MFSEEAEVKAERAEALEEEREERGLKLRDTKSRVKKYDRLKKRTRTKVRKFKAVYGGAILHLYLCLLIIQGVRDKKLRHMLKTSDIQAQKAARKAARSELLLQEQPG